MTMSVSVGKPEEEKEQCEWQEDDLCDDVSCDKCGCIRSSAPSVYDPDAVSHLCHLLFSLLYCL